MIVADVNVFLYAMSPRFGQHEQARAWLSRTLGSGEPFGTWEPILASVFRIATQPALFDPPASPKAIFGFLETVRQAPAHMSLTPSPELWNRFENLARLTGRLASRSSDLLLAALAIDQNATFVSYDRDFANIPGLVWRIPD